jgi:hypothetical protein
MAESYRYGNVPPDSYPVRSEFQKDQRFGWIEGSGAVTKNPRGGDWVQIGNNSEVGSRMYTSKPFTTGMQNGRKRPL